ncbi:hypothetical protein KIN20_025137 [Parelaphostrongylus tenuis]|uniref:Uncharacterized protein n=1 Tax=Parelaphostrongylus tenuis TaxID=148309 RepID=A0AAD5MUN8_PARTN|nr:hypothetical protein KIN20_025137 [Parelaphostrongylus tenuis]
MVGDRLLMWFDGDAQTQPQTWRVGRRGWTNHSPPPPAGECRSALAIARPLHLGPLVPTRVQTPSIAIYHGRVNVLVAHHHTPVLEARSNLCVQTSFPLSTKLSMDDHREKLKD